MPYQRPAHRGDYPRVGNTLQLMAERLVEAADVHAGQRVLDVACGQGNALANWTPEGLVGVHVQDHRRVHAISRPASGRPCCRTPKRRLAELFSDTVVRHHPPARRSSSAGQASILGMHPAVLRPFAG